MTKSKTPIRTARNLTSNDLARAAGGIYGGVQETDSWTQLKAVKSLTSGIGGLIG